jgi:hypothetical protein
MGVVCADKKPKHNASPAPIPNTNALRIQLYFGGLLLLTLTLV